MIRHITLSLIFLFYLAPNVSIAKQTSKISFWDNKQTGANIFNQEVSREDIKAAKSYGIKFIRLAPDKFVSTQKDFLIGDAGNYKALNSQDIKKLKQVLDICAKEQMPVIITMLSLPGSRWKQKNNGRDDLRLWQDKKFLKQAAQFWQDLARELKSYSCIIGYNILNEPHLERIYDSTSLNIDKVNQEEVQEKLYNFNQAIISAIRLEDSETPIILDSSAYADPKTFKNLKPCSDSKVIYSFHMYEPYSYTNLKINGGKYSYPGMINKKIWDKKALKDYLKEVASFQQRHNISSNRILVGEFGGNRQVKGLANYFQDLADIFKDNSWHFAFYAFREDNWDGMDYELGDKKLPWSYWQSVEKGEPPKLKRNHNNPIFKVLLNSLGNKKYD